MSLFTELLDEPYSKWFTYDEIYNTISTLLETKSPETILEILKKDGRVLQFIKNQTREMCIVACQYDGWALEFVNEQTEEICIIACESDSYMLNFVDNLTDEIRLAACRHDGKTLSVIKNQTEEMCIVACRQNGMTLKFVNNQNEKTCIEAIKNNKDAIQYIDWKQMVYYYRFTIQYCQDFKTKKQAEQLFSHKKSGIIDYNFNQHYDIKIFCEFFLAGGYGGGTPPVP